MTWQPALGVPGAARRDQDHNLDPAAEVTTAYGFDHLLMAVHTEAADALLPYSHEHEEVRFAVLLQRRCACSVGPTPRAQSPKP